MIKRKHRLLGLVLCTAVLLGGCGNYRELNEFDIVAGMAIDRARDGYKLTLELMKLEGDMKDGMQSVAVVLEGETIPQAVELAKARFAKQFQFGNVQVIVISDELARDEGIGELLDSFLRDRDIRETIQLLISTDGEAGDVLAAKGIDAPVASYALEQLVNPVHERNTHVREISIYNAYDVLHTPGKTLVLPVVHTWEKEGEQYLELNGIAAFSGDRLWDLLPESETPYYLYAIDKLRIHRLVFPVPDHQGFATISVRRSKTRRSFREADSGIVFRFDIEAGGLLAQTPLAVDTADPKVRSALEQAASEQLRADIADLIEECRDADGVDLTDMGYDIYLWDPALWETMEADWRERQKEIAVEIAVRVTILNSGTIQGT